jgi:hypothetical protein
MRLGCAESPGQDTSRPARCGCITASEQRCTLAMRRARHRSARDARCVPQRAAWQSTAPRAATASSVHDQPRTCADGSWPCVSVPVCALGRTPNTSRWLSQWLRAPSPRARPRSLKLAVRRCDVDRLYHDSKQDAARFTTPPALPHPPHLPSTNAHRCLSSPARRPCACASSTSPRPASSPWARNPTTTAAMASCTPSRTSTARTPTSRT